MMNAEERKIKSDELQNQLDQLESNINSENKRFLAGIRELNEFLKLNSELNLMRARRLVLKRKINELKPEYKKKAA